MPFKTRKHKTAASERRIIFSEKAIRYQSSSVEFAPDKKIKTEKVESLSSHEDYYFVRGDLIKIVIISTVIIGVQIAMAALNFPHA